jgi:hypothetical protein
MIHGKPFWVHSPDLPDGIDPQESSTKHRIKNRIRYSIKHVPPFDAIWA